MTHPIRQVLVDRDKLCRQMLGSLPEHCLGGQSIDAYARDVVAQPVMAVGHQGTDAGMLALRWRFEDACEVWLLAVLPQYQRRGLGRALLVAAEEFARGQGFRLLYVKLPASAVGARQFFESGGFFPVDELLSTAAAEPPGLLVAKTLC